MMKYIISALWIFMFSCASGPDFVIKTEPDDSKMLVGQISREILFNEFPEWRLGLEYYRPDQKIIDSLKQINKSISVEIYLGTWCGDSRREVPHFFKITDDLKSSLFNDIQIWAVERNKTLPGSNLAKEKEIQYVATFIFYDGTREWGGLLNNRKTASSQIY